MQNAFRRLRGPQKKTTKIQTTLRLDEDILLELCATGKGWQTRVNDALRTRLQAPPVDGKANEALIRFIADQCDIPKSHVQITHGFTSRKKLLEIKTTALTKADMEKIFSKT